MPRPPRRALLAALLALASCDGGGGIVGTWEPAGGTGSRTTFFADGSARIVTAAADAAGPPEAYDARYAVSGDTVLTLSDDDGAERFRLRASPDTLVLESPATGSRTVLVRVRG